MEFIEERNKLERILLSVVLSLLRKHSVECCIKIILEEEVNALSVTSRSFRWKLD